MKWVLVDPFTSTIRAEAGCTQADLGHAAHDFGLAVPLGIGYCCDTTMPIAG
jgi:FAD/FMN-containing dehydrogenase